MESRTTRQKNDSVDQQYNSVSVYYSNNPNDSKNPSFKKTIRAIKNSVRKYDKGQILITELTSNTNILPQPSALNQLVQHLNLHKSGTDAATFKTLWKRLTDYGKLRHVEKSLLVMEHLLSQKAQFYSTSFEEYCKDHKPEFIKLQHYSFTVGRSEIGQNVRQRAGNLYEILFKSSTNEQNSVEITPKGKDIKQEHKETDDGRPIHMEHAVEDDTTAGETPVDTKKGKRRDIFAIFRGKPAEKQIDDDTERERTGTVCDE